MFDSDFQLHWWIWYLLPFLPCNTVAQLPVPATVEVDLIFPRNNETYSLTAHMPIVFAIQNSRYAAPLDLSFRYMLFKGARITVEKTIIADREIRLKYADFSSSDPYFALDSVPYMHTTEDGWTLIWTSVSANCSFTPINFNTSRSPSMLGPRLYGTHIAQDADPIEFTIKKDARQPDLVAATSDDTCARSGNFTFDVTEILNVSYTGQFNGRSSCAVFPTPLSTPRANPCGAKLNSTEAASILAAITSCGTHQPNATTGCVPLTTSNGLGRGEQISRGRMMFLIATSAWLLYLVR
jgi:hypothetical protein